MPGEDTFLKLKSKQHVKLYVQLVFQITVFDFIYPREKAYIA